MSFSAHKTKLSVNVNKIATLRNARGKDLPNLLQVSLDLINFGAQGITVHPRPDGRHIRREDVFLLKEKIGVEFNIEGYPSADFIEMCCEVKPEQVTLVPDPPDALTSNAGFDVPKQAKLLAEALTKLKAAQTRVSVFVENNLLAKDFEYLRSIGCDRVELYTEDFADHFGTGRQQEVIAKYVQTAKLASASQLGINAGHDLNLKNLQFFKKSIPGLLEVSIGHALISDSLYFGFKETIKKYLECLK